jgi:hypothetical protein
MHGSLKGNSPIGPFQSETQYLQILFRGIADRKYSGNPFLLYFLFISTLFPLPAISAGIAEIERKHVSTSEMHIINKGNNYNDR